MYLGLASQAKDNIELYNYYYRTKKTQTKKVNDKEKNCDICKKLGKIHFRVKSINYTIWIFCWKKCWNIVSKEDQYSYGGTRKA